ncbi:MAG: HAMP domain-containing histidine kinase [Oscillospiraceae bacterium]|nr:HAMP domain-containing histidine kinase [Oscillospiraceae bacterium]
MTRRLCIKFVSLSMGLLLALLVVLLSIINVVNYRSVCTSLDTTLDILASNSGSFPSSGDSQGPAREQSYESRYFTVRLDGDGQVFSTNLTHIATVDVQQASEYAQQVWESGRESGFLDVYRYCVTTQHGNTLIIFLHAGRKLADFRSFLQISIWSTLAGYLVTFGLCVLLSRRIVKPFSDNYEKQKLFITDAGHELKTPLTIIDADAQVLEMELGENEWLQDIQEQTRRLAVMTNALIYLARMEEAQNKSQVIDFPLSDVVSETAQSFHALAISQGKDLQTDIQSGLSLRGDDRAMRHLTSILLDNAVKYSGPEGRILLSLHRTGSTLRLCVQNSAQPLSPEDLKHLFDRFYRTDRSRSSKTGGYGIGLSIAKAIVTAHKGTIKAAAPDGCSLSITASFPA